MTSEELQDISNCWVCPDCNTIVDASTGAPHVCAGKMVQAPSTNDLILAELKAIRALLDTHLPRKVS